MGCAVGETASGVNCGDERLVCDWQPMQVTALSDSGSAVSHLDCCDCNDNGLADGAVVRSITAALPLGAVVSYGHCSSASCAASTQQQSADSLSKLVWAALGVRRCDVQQATWMRGEAVDDAAQVAEQRYVDVKHSTPFALYFKLGLQRLCKQKT